MVAEPTVVPKPSRKYNDKQVKRLSGVSFRPQHYNDLLEKNINTSWIEVITENYLGTIGPRKTQLLNLLEKFNVSLHGVSLNIASQDKLNDQYLSKLKELIDELRPIRVSDHLCWTGAHGLNSHDLLPFPYTKKMLDFICTKVDKVQAKLKRKLVLENLSSYFQFKENEFTECEFINQLCKKTGAGILLDINNLYVNSINQKLHLNNELDKIDFNYVEEIHIAGHFEGEKFLIDTHSMPVKNEVWDIFKFIYNEKKPVPFCLEWDDKIPPFDRFYQEIEKAQQIIENIHV